MTNATLHRSYRGLITVLISLLLVACAGQQNTEARACGIGKTLACV